MAEIPSFKVGYLSLSTVGLLAWAAAPFIMADAALKGRRDVGLAGVLLLIIMGAMGAIGLAAGVLAATWAIRPGPAWERRLRYVLAVLMVITLPVVLVVAVLTGPPMR